MFLFGLGHYIRIKYIKVIVLIIGWVFFGIHAYIINQIAPHYTVWQIAGYLLFLAAELFVFLFLFRRLLGR